MPDNGEVAATRVALLELRDERRLVQEGYELLDEKRVLLATEILRELRAHEVAQTTLDRLWLEAREALAGAVEVHGFDDLTVEPPVPARHRAVATGAAQFLGLRLVDAALDAAPCVPASPPAQASPEAQALRGGLSRSSQANWSRKRPAPANLRRLIERIPPDGASRPGARERAAAGDRPFAAVHRGATRRRRPGGSRPRPQRRQGPDLTPALRPST